MTRLYSFGVVTATLFAIGTAVQSGFTVRSDTNVISVNGEAEVRVVPDEVVLNFGVETFDSVLRTAKAMNDERVKKTIAAARDRGVAAEHIQTDYVGIEPRYPRSDITTGILGYVTRKSIVIRLKDLTRFEDLLSAALEAGVTHVHGIDFRTTELRKYRDEARAAALKAAHEKAALLANQASRRMGPVMSISEASYGYHSSYGSGWGNRFGSMSQNSVQSLGGAGLESDATISPGQIAIRVSVSATFALN